MPLGKTTKRRIQMSLICIIGQMIILLLVGLLSLGDVDSYRWIITFPGIGAVCFGIASFLGLFLGTKNMTKDVFLKVPLLTLLFGIIAYLLLVFWVFACVEYGEIRFVMIISLVWGMIFVINFLLTLISTWIIWKSRPVL